MKTVLNWSSGKDAAMAYHILSMNDGYEVTHLLTTVNSEHSRIVMHGIKEELLDAQAAAMALSVKKIYLPASTQDELYKKAMQQVLNELKQEGVKASAFGDIFLEDLRNYREQQLQTVDIQAVFPLWKIDTVELVKAIEHAGIEAILVCVNEKFLGKEFLGRKVGRDLLNDLPAGADPCGENGEFHTFVYNAPFFRAPVPISLGEIVYKQYMPASNDKDKWDTGFYFLDVNKK